MNLLLRPFLRPPGRVLDRDEEPSFDVYDEDDELVVLLTVIVDASQEP